MQASSKPDPKVNRKTHEDATTWNKASSVGGEGVLKILAAMAWAYSDMVNGKGRKK